MERPICGDCKVLAFPSRQAAEPGTTGGRVGVTRVTEADVTDLPRELASAVLLGLRVDTYLALVAAENPFAPTGSKSPGGTPLSEEPQMLWPELFEGLTAWHTTNGNPHAIIDLVKLARAGNTGAERFLSAFDRAGHLIGGLRREPPGIERRFTGRAGPQARRSAPQAGASSAENRPARGRPLQGNPSGRRPKAPPAPQARPVPRSRSRAPQARTPQPRAAGARP